MISKRQADQSMSIDQLVGARLSALMLKNELTADELARDLGLQPSHIAEFCAGTRRIGATLLIEISRLLHVNVIDFYADVTETGENG